MKWQVREAATAAELDRCLAVRREVFIEEQGVSEADEVDDLDDTCRHLLVFPSGTTTLTGAVGTARLLLVEPGRMKAQRVAVQKNMRGGGAGRALMTQLETLAWQGGCEQVVLGAQLEALPFYERLGYVAYGEVFDDAGIPHRMMQKTLRSWVGGPG
ncbi:MAG: GNAT family N-acetyltransferase [Myxococcota bacterium]